VKLNFDEEALGKILLPPDAALSRLPFLDLSDDELQRVRNGMSVRVSETEWSEGEQVRLRDQSGNLFAVADFKAAESSLHPRVVLAHD
jgi:tRNA U55 pseudouridine synthase TruB